MSVLELLTRSNTVLGSYEDVPNTKLFDFGFANEERAMVLANYFGQEKCDGIWGAAFGPNDAVHGGEAKPLPGIHPPRQWRSRHFWQIPSFFRSNECCILMPTFWPEGDCGITTWVSVLRRLFALATRKLIADHTSTPERC